MPEFSILEQQIEERERQLIAEAAFGKGLMSLPSDWEKARPQRLKKVLKHSADAFFYFCKTYFPQWFEFDFSDEHRKMINAALSNDRKIHFFAAPRDFGKTRIFRVFKVWCGICGAKNHYSKASDTIDLVLKDFRYVRNIFKHNPKIVSDFGNVIDETWDTQHSFRVKPHKHNPAGTTYVANSMTVTPRGELGDTGRLDFEEFDDCEDYSTSINAEMSRQKLEIIERDFHQALIDTGCAVYLGNNARTTCIINILAQMSDADRTAQHPALALSIIDEWDEKNNRPTWHQRYSYESEEEMRLALKLSKSVWNAERRQRPSPPEGDIFKLGHWRTYEQLPPDAVGIAMNDPALGSASYKTGVVLLYSPSTKLFYVPECFVRRADFEKYFLWNYSMWERWGKRLLWIGWEEDFHQAEYLKFISDYESTRKRPRLPIRPISVRGHGSKEFRIEQLESPFSMGQILFAKDFLSTPDGVEAQSMTIGYQGKQDSKHPAHFPDCLSTAYRELWPIALRMSRGNESEIKIGGRRRSAERY